MNANPSHSSGSTSSDRTAKRSWKEKPGATRWNPGAESADERGGSSRRKPAIIDRLTAGDRSHSGPSAGTLAAVCADPRLITDLVAALDHDDIAVRRRAADTIEKATRNNPEWLAAHRDLLLPRATARDERQDILCRLIPLVPRMKPTGAELRRATSDLFVLVDGPGRSVQVCAMQALYDLAVNRPRLRARVIEVLEKRMGDGSPAVRARARRLLTEASGRSGRPRRRRR